MKTDNKKLIKLLGYLNVLDTEEITENNPKESNDITYTTNTITGLDEKEYRIITDNIDDETLPLLLKAEQLKTLRNIDKTLSFFKTLAIIGLVCFGLSILFGVWW